MYRPSYSPYCQHTWTRYWTRSRTPSSTVKDIFQMFSFLEGILINTSHGNDKTSWTGCPFVLQYFSTTYLLPSPSTFSRGKVKDLHIKIYLFLFFNICGFKKSAANMSDDCTLCFKASCIFSIVWFVCLTLGMLSTVQSLLHPNLTYHIYHILQAPSTVRSKQYRTE